MAEVGCPTHALRRQLNDEGADLNVQATQLRPGMVIRYKGDICTVHKTEHRTPGNKRGFVQAKMRNHRSGAMIEEKLASEDIVHKVMLESREMQYLYSDGQAHHLMDTETYEQIELTDEQLGDQVHYMIIETVVKVQFLDGVPFNLDLPSSVDLKVVETEPAIKGATVTNVNKPARTETGLIVQVPPFIRQGESIRVNTADGSYLGRS